MLTKEEWIQWKNQETTKKVFALLEEEQANIKQAWADGQFFDTRVNDRMLGTIAGLTRVLDMEVEDEE